MAPKDDTSVAPGIYSPRFLRFFYDTWVLGITNTYIWRCPTSRILLPFFRCHASSNHLDIGVGTGYFLAHAEFAKDASVTLCDVNPSSLAMARSRISDLETHSLLHDALKPLPTAERFGSISLMYLLHCMPGPPQRKAAIFGNLKKNLKKGGTVFGATVLGKGVEHNWAGRLLMDHYNKNGILANREDDAEVFLNELKLHFEEVDAKIEGVVLLFTAKGPM